MKRALLFICALATITFTINTSVASDTVMKVTELLEGYERGIGYLVKCGNYDQAMQQYPAYMEGAQAAAVGLGDALKKANPSINPVQQLTQTMQHVEVIRTKVRGKIVGDGCESQYALESRQHFVDFREIDTMQIKQLIGKL